MTKTHYFITGSSRGIGNSLANLLLKEEQNFITGIARTNTISHPNFQFSALDLNDLTAVTNFHFNVNPSIDKIILINNAGTTGAIKHIGNLDNKSIIKSFNINTISPIILTNTLIKGNTRNIPLLILNISSGAANSVIDGWSSYCASKAALDVFAKVTSQELKLDKKDTTHILNIAPGVVDTAMQTSIRNASKTHFSALDDFINMKKNGSLKSPSAIAAMILDVIDNYTDSSNVIQSLRDHPTYTHPT